MEAGLHTKHTQERTRQVNPWLCGGSKQHLSVTSLFHVGACCSTTFLSTWKWCVQALYVHKSSFIFLRLISLFLNLFFLINKNILTYRKTNCVLTLITLTCFWPHRSRSERKFHYLLLGDWVTQRFIDKCSISSTSLCLNRFTLVLTPSPTL